MRKFRIAALMLLVVLVTYMTRCVTLSELEKAANEDHLSASYGKYYIDPVVNEVGLKRLYSDLEHSDCGLSDEAFMKYARERINYKRQFQFIVFLEGKPLVGKRCYRRALIFYLKER